MNTDALGVSPGHRLKNFMSFTEANGTSILQINSVYNSKVIFELNTLAFDEYLNSYSATLHTQQGDKFRGVLGLGDQVSADLFLKDGVYSLWARDQPDPVQHGTLPGANLYGTHPFFIYRAQDDLAYGVFTNVASAQDWYLKNDASAGQIDCTMMAAGGAGELIFVYSQSQSYEQVVRYGYHPIVGMPVQIPRWALGWHQSRYGYNSTD